MPGVIQSMFWFSCQFPILLRQILADGTVKMNEIIKVAATRLMV